MSDSEQLKQKIEELKGKTSVNAVAQTAPENLSYSGMKFGTQGAYIRKSAVGRNIFAATRPVVSHHFSNKNVALNSNKMPQNFQDMFVKIDSSEKPFLTTKKEEHVLSYSLSRDGMTSISIPFRKMTHKDVEHKVSVKKVINVIIMPK